MAQNTFPTNIKTFSVISAIVLSLGIATPSAFAGGTSTLGLDTEIEEPSTTNGVGGAELWMALGLTALAPGAALAAFLANINLSALNGTNGFKLSSVAAGDLSGRAVSTAGDVNGDGVDDLLIGAFLADPNGAFSGASYVIFGGAGVGNSSHLEFSALDGHERL